ncbi:MAG: PorT family protein [Bacteroidia bacterium]|nr:PorT family protein [Bacteroidia bacterium]
MTRLFFLGCAFLAAQNERQTWFGARLGTNWGQYYTKAEDITSRSTWGGGFHGALALQHQLDQKGRFALQGELGITQRRSTERTLLSDYRYTLWSSDVGVIGVFRWLRKFEILMIEAGPSSSILLTGRYWQRDNLNGEENTRRVNFGRGGERDVRRGEIALNLGMNAAYLMGPGYLSFGLRFWHGINNLAGGAFQRWNSYGFLMSVSYWYNDALRE